MKTTYSIGLTRINCGVTFINFPLDHWGMYARLENLTSPTFEMHFVYETFTAEDKEKRSARFVKELGFAPITFSFIDYEDPSLAVCVQQQLLRQQDYINHHDELIDPSFKFEMDIAALSTKLQGCHIAGVNYEQLSADSEDCRITVTVEYDKIQSNSPSKTVA